MTELFAPEYLRTGICRSLYVSFWSYGGREKKYITEQAMKKYMSVYQDYGTEGTAGWQMIPCGNGYMPKLPAVHLSAECSKRIREKRI